MPSLNLAINFHRAPGNVSQMKGATLLRYIANLVQGAAAGKNPANSVIASIENGAALGTGYLQQSCARMALSSGAGTVGPTIAGVAATQTWATSDTATMTAICAGIRANASINRIVTACNLTMRLTCGVVTAGQQVRIGAAVFTAVNGTPTLENTFDMSSGVAATIAASLVLAINRSTGCQGKYVACAASAVIDVCLSTNRAVGQSDSVQTFAPATITVQKPTPAVDAVGFIICNTPGLVGNEVRATIAGTGATITTPGTTNCLGGGQGGGTLPYFQLG